MAPRHVTVFAQDGFYAGWPANHGAWQWGDEFLFGFIRGKHRIGGMHNIAGRLNKVLARSLDGGETWAVEVPNVDFNATKAYELKPAPDFSLSDSSLSDSIIRVCGNYDHGGESCHQSGAFYLSHDKGKSWDGAFSFDGIDLPNNQQGTSRTCVLGDLIFLSAATRHHWGSDYTFCATVDNGKFVGRSVVLNDHARAVMPAAARVGERIVIALRRRGTNRPGGWIDAVWSDDDAMTWSDPVHVTDTGKDNGNPPALIEAGGKLYCAYGNRSMMGIYVAVSADRGVTWHHHATLREGKTPDIGYPRLFKRADGKLVCVYYWADKYEQAQSIQATIFDA